MPSSAPSGPAAIAVTDVATKVTEVANQLQGIAQKLIPSPEVETIRQSLLDLSPQLDQELAATAKILEGQPALPTLQAQQQQWEQLQTKTTDWLSVLTKRSTDLQEALDSLTGLEKTWEATFKASQDAKAPGPILQQISGTLASIQTTRIPLQTQLSSVLDLQSGVSGEVAKCGTILAKIARDQQTSMSGILVQDSLPIMSPELWAGQLPGLRARVSGIGTTYVANVNKYLRDDAEGALVHARFLALLIFLFLAARYQVRRLTAAGVTFTPATRVFDHPIGAALTMTVLLVTSPYWPVPAVLLRTFQLLAFAPMILLIRTVLPVRLVTGLHMLWLLVAIDVVREAFSGELLFGQIILLIESLGGIMTTLWFLRRLRPALGDAASSNRLHMFQSGAVLVLLILLPVLRPLSWDICGLPAC